MIWEIHKVPSHWEPMLTYHPTTLHEMGLVRIATQR